MYNHNPASTNKHRNQLTILQCETLYKFRYESLKMWQRVIVDTIKSKERAEYTRTFIKQEYMEYSKERTGKEMRFTMSKGMIEAFLEDYKHRDEDTPMATVGADSEGEMVLIPADRYISKEARQNSEYNFAEVL